MSSSIEYMAPSDRIGYCLFVHKNPLQVRRLLDRIFDEQDFFHITIFCDRKNEEEWRETLPLDRDNVHADFTRPGAHATFFQVAATLNAMRFLKDHDIQHMIMLSGQCYPMWPIKEIKKRLAIDRSYVASIPEPEFNIIAKDRFRYNSIRVPYPNLIRSILGKKKNDNNIFIKYRRIINRLPANMSQYKGSNWMVLRKEHMIYILDYVDRHPKYLRYFRNFNCADESFFQIILLNSKFKDEIINKCQTYVDWTDRGGPRPNFLTSDDLDAIMSSDCLFARKFDVDKDEKILERIDEMRLKVKE